MNKITLRNNFHLLNDLKIYNEFNIMNKYSGLLSDEKNLKFDDKGIYLNNFLVIRFFNRIEITYTNDISFINIFQHYKRNPKLRLFVDYDLVTIINRELTLKKLLK